MSKPFVFMAAALAEDGGIGYKNGLPWKIPGDWSYFQQVTTKSYGEQPLVYKDDTEWSNVVVMGRLSFESRPMLSVPLENRFNIVVSRNPEYKLPDTRYSQLCHSLSEAFNAADALVKDHGRVFVLGGEEIYRQSINLPGCTHVLITSVHSDIPIPCDTFIPKIDPDVFQKATHEELELFLKESVPKGMQTFENFNYEFELYTRK